MLDGPIAFVFTALCMLPAAAHAQGHARRDTVPWVTHRNLIAAEAAVGTTLLLVPFDRPISSEFTEPAWARGQIKRRVADRIAIVGGGDPLMASAAIAVVAEGLGFPGAAAVATHTTESILLAGGVAGIVRGVTGRALPSVSTKDEFSFGRGFHDRNGPFVSFPSGHTASAFAIAAVLSGEVGRAHPRLARFVTPFVYTVATAVGFARVAQRVHWPTDLPLGLLIGTWSGQTIEAHFAGDSTRRAP